ncbi:retrovirus-related pol polyprotein from transposon TNT 1-94 [Tanacetum coccineum]
MLIQHQSEVGDSLDRAATTASSLEAEQVSGNITKTRSKATLNEPTPQGTGSGSGPRRQDTKGDTIARTRFENVSKTSYDSPLGGVNTPRSDEDRDYKPEKEGQEARTKRKVKNSRVEKGRNIAEIDADVDILLVHEDVGIQGRFDEDMFDTSVFNDEEVFAGQDMADQEVNVAEKEVSAADPVTIAGEVVTTASVDISTASVPITVSTATPTTPPTTTTEDDMTLAETLMEIKSAKPKAIGVVMQEPSEIPRISAAQQQIQEKAQGLRDKGKAKIVEEEEPKEPTKIKDQIKHDEELAQRLDAQLQAEMEKEDRLARQREEEDNIVSWDYAQAMMEADYQMAERLHAEEQTLLTDEEKASLFMQLLDIRKKHFTALRAQEIRNKPPTKMQKRTTMCNYLKNMAGYKHNQLRHKSFDDIQKLFYKALKRVNTFMPMDTEKVEGSKAKAAGSKTRVKESSKRAGEELDRESTKKKKVEDVTEQAELKECLKIIPFDEDAVNTIPLATKQAPIVDYKITRDARKIYYHITRADGSTKVYMRFKDMLKMFDREDLEVLYRIVNDMFKSTKPVGDNRVLWGNLMTMFEPSTGDKMWREQGRYLIKSWKLIDSCRVHCLMLESMYIYMLVEKEYPLA